MTRDRPRTLLRYLLAVSMIGIGAYHFINAPWFVAIVPRALPAPEALVMVSGVFEMLGGLGLLVPKARRFSSIGLALLYVAVFPANINMAMNPEYGHGVAPALLWARLPLQIVFIAWALWTGRPDRKADGALAPG
jgi:uncharacterized membrane protein